MPKIWSPIKPNLYILLGPSRAGKDTLARELYGYNIKITYHFKRHIEQMHDLPKLALEDPNVRNSQVPDMPEGYTYLDLMIASFKAVESFDPYLYIRPAMRQAERLLKGDIPVIFTDLRKPIEVKKAIELFPLSNPKVFLLEGRGVLLESDLSLEENVKLLSEYTEVHRIDSSGNVENTVSAVRNILNPDLVKIA